MKPEEQMHQKPLRLWPGIILGILLLTISYIVPVFMPERMDISALGGLLCCLLIIIWWVLFSRALHFDRWGAIILIVAAIFITPYFLHPSISTGNMGLMFVLFATPIFSLVLVAWAVFTRRFSKWTKRAILVLAILLVCIVWTLLRSIGINGNGSPTFVWRWTPTPEELFLTKPSDEPKGSNPDTIGIKAEASWLGFRGQNRDGIVHGISIKTDWKAFPPVELWRRAVGPGCSSFAVSGEMLYTQEQRGEEELVISYNLLTGKPIWKHSDKARFWDSHAGAGPRATPTLCNSRLYTLGATGILNVLDAKSGNLVWSHNVATETKTKSPIWAFSGSPLVMNNMVIVPIAGSLLACDTATGKRLWFIPAGGDCYSSPHLLTIKGTQQLLFLNEAGLAGINPDNGKIFWKYANKGNPILQPALTSDGDILVSTNPFEGLHCISVLNEKDGWKIKERWISVFKPNHNDFVVHKGYIYGLDGSGIQCVDVKTGQRKWKGNRYGGQIILLADEDMLLVLSEKGEIALVSATPGQFKELARISAIKGKTWNHPVLAGDVLVVRNSEEMVAFRLPQEGK
jgi:outer membrane protein assembly factor BamB